MSSHWAVVNKGAVVVSNSPQQLWDSAVAYFHWCDENPIKSKKVVPTGKEAGREYTVNLTRPYTIKGLCLHCGILQEYMADLRNSKDKDSMWYIVVSRIMYIIYTQNQEMAMVGEFNQAITGKILGIDKEDAAPVSSIKVQIVEGLPPLSNSENEVLEKLVLENGEIRERAFE